MAPLDSLMRKTALLLRFATAAWISEIHALDITMVALQMAGDGVLLMDFVAKIQFPDQSSLIYSVLMTITRAYEDEGLPPPLASNPRA